MSIGLIFCMLSLSTCFIASRRSTVAGISALWVIGCFYGILRANFLDGFSHFIFDAGLIGFYMGEFSKPVAARAAEASRPIRIWLILLIGWPLVLFLLPINHYLVQLVGLRHVIIFLPALLIGSRLSEPEIRKLGYMVAIVNVVSFGFAIAEYIYGIQPFYPLNSVTENMYRSRDVKTSAGTFYRIVSTFISAHAYAGTMVITIPLIMNSIWGSKKSAVRLAMTAAFILTILGMFIAGPRLPIVILAGMTALMLVVPGLKGSVRISLFVATAVIGGTCIYYVIFDERLQRFSSLADTEMVANRARYSLSFPLLESFKRYPLGAGLGGVFGASLPYFLQSLAPETLVGAENEYARIAAEQGIVGFFIWMAFIWKLLSRRQKVNNENFRVGINAMWALAVLMWVTAFVGTGLLQSIPCTFLMLLQFGILLRAVPAARPIEAGKFRSSFPMAAQRIARIAVVPGRSAAETPH